MKVQDLQIVSSIVGQDASRDLLDTLIFGRDSKYPRDYRSRYGVLRRVIPKVVDKFMGCGDFAKAFARVRCDECSHEYLLAFTCKGCWFCPSCHQKKVQMFGALLAESIFAAVPHRQITFGIPKMLRPYFRLHRELLKQLCRIAHQCVSDFLRDAFGERDGVDNGEQDGVPAIVMAIHTFGEYLDFQRSIRCCALNASTKCASCHSSMTRRSSSTSCGMLACG